MTTNPDAVSVDPQEVRTHADKLEVLMGSVDECLEAATYLASADDGYGNMLRSLMTWIFEDNHRTTIEVIRKAGESTAQLPENLKTVATTFEDADGSFARKLQELQATIGESK
ncbi:type VII secretion target [Nocardia sp. NPDC050793]|uniref:type VII secretion target n=1 Tax=Nocardia sp. NPDC050793 TaxID=3155159 RepID=UPI0033E58F98